MLIARCIRAVADLHAAPDAASERVSQCLFGERVAVLERAGEWCRVRARRDGYAGHVRAEALAETTDDPNGDRPDACVGIVGVRATLLFAEPDLKSPLRLRVPFGSELTLPGDGGLGSRGAADAGFVRVTDLGDGERDAFVWRDHCLAPGETLVGTPVDVARRLHDGAPYLWGGRTPDGTDCSGLVQGTAFALGLALPRDSGDQERALEHVVPFDERTASDAVFWPGHVGLLIDPETLYHATAHVLATTAEPLADVIARAGPPSSIRRLSRRRDDA